MSETDNFQPLARTIVYAKVFLCKAQSMQWYQVCCKKVRSNTFNQEYTLIDKTHHPEILGIIFMAELALISAAVLIEQEKLCPRIFSLGERSLIF